MELSISIVTYNRAWCVKQLLTVLSESILKDHHINLLDNCSTDDTVAVAKRFAPLLPQMQIISNTVNIGADANIMRAIELSQGNYTWVMCDDDNFNLDAIADVLAAINKGEVDLLHVGAHPDDNWAQFGGITDTPRNLLKQGYPYFKFSSFTTCNIFRTSVFKENFIISGYRNIANSYPHMPFLIDQFERDKKIYISQKQLVIASLGSDYYLLSDFFYWWIATSKLLKNESDVRLFFLDQWRKIGINDEKSGLDILIHLLKQGKDQKLVSDYVKRYFTSADKAYIFKKTFMNGAYYTILGKIRRVKQKLVG